MKIIIAIIVLLISADSFSQTASSKPLSAVFPDSLRRVNRHRPASPETLASAKPPPEFATRLKNRPRRQINQRELPGNAPVNVDSIRNRYRRQLRDR